MLAAERFTDRRARAHPSVPTILNMVTGKLNERVDLNDSSRV